MTQRTISLNENAYKKLKKKKRNNESYSDLIIRLVDEEDRKEKEDIFLKFAGVFEDDAEYWSSVEEKITKNRNSHLITEED